MSSILDRLSRYILKGARLRPTLPQLIEQESKLGSTIFGALPQGVSGRHFFYDKDGHWYFSQTIMTGRPREETIHYHVVGHGIQKTASVRYLGEAQQPTPLRYEWLEGNEKADLLNAVKLYKQRITRLYDNSASSRAA